MVSFPHSPPKRNGLGMARALLGSWLSELPVDLWKWRVPQLRAEVRRLMAGGQVDLCVADFLVAVPNVPLGGPVPVVLFEHNVEHMIWKRLAAVEPTALAAAAPGARGRKMRRFEARACAQASLTLTVSEPDAALLAAAAPAARVARRPHRRRHDLLRPERPAAISADLVFTGSMDWYPNEDAILHFADHTLPRIRREIPETSLTVVGRKPSARLRAAASGAGIDVTGAVDDIRPYVAQAAVYVVPLRVGGGTRLKICEALAMGKAVVSTTIGAEGLPLVPGEHFVRADEPAEFAQAVISLLRDPERRGALGAAGRRLMAERYSWPQVAGEFDARCREVAS